MKALTCEMCGSTNLIKDGGVFVCQSCGTKYSVEEAKKMMIDGVVSVKVDVSDELKNLYEIARRAKETGNSDNAARYYDMILVKDPNSWEANFYVVYFKAMSCKIINIRSAADSILSCLKVVFRIIKDNVSDKEEQRKILSEILVMNGNIAQMLFGAARNHYEGIDDSIRDDYTQEYLDRASATKEIMYAYGNYIIEIFGDEYIDLAASAWKRGINIHKQYVKYTQNKSGNIYMINRYADKIRKHDSSYVNPDVEKCYIATSIYGSYDCPEVWTLRRFRDYTLAETWYGRLFIKAYYATSPTLVRLFGDTLWFKNICKKPLDRLVSKLRIKGVENTPYKDKI